MRWLFMRWFLTTVILAAAGLCLALGVKSELDAIERRE